MPPLQAQAKIFSPNVVLGVVLRSLRVMNRTNYRHSHGFPSKSLTCLLHGNSFNSNISTKPI